jgi:hypothetical protein
MAGGRAHAPNAESVRYSSLSRRARRPDGDVGQTTRRGLGGDLCQRDRYRHAAEIQQNSGIAPVTQASGQQHWVHWRWSCPKFLRQTFHEWAEKSMPYSDWAQAYYRAQREDKNKSHYAAVTIAGV